MGKKLLTNKTDKILCKIASIDSRANENKINTLKKYTATAGSYNELQIAAEAFGANLTPICKKAARTHNTTELTGKLRNFNTTLHASQLSDTDKKSILEQSTKLENLIKTFTTHLTNPDTGKSLMILPDSTLKALTETVSELNKTAKNLAKTCRTKKQKLKKYVETELHAIDTVCKKAANYEKWFEISKNKFDKLKTLYKTLSSKTPEIIKKFNVLNNQAAALQKQARNNWTKYRQYCISEPQKNYLLDGYAAQFDTYNRKDTPNNGLNYQIAFDNYNAIKTRVDT